MSRRELLGFLAVAAAAIAALALGGGSVFWTHPLWTDEWCCTVYPVQEAATPIAVIRNIAAPQDYAPPLLHLIVWTVGKLTGGIGPIGLRSIPLVSVVLGALFMYAALRSRFDAWASTAGIIAVLSHPQIVRQAFEGRAYGTWILFAALYAWSLTQPRKWIQAVASACVVAIHWFGVISLGFMAVGAFAAFGRDWRGALRKLAPSAAGLVMLAVLYPMVVAQREGSSAFLWIAPLSSAQVWGIVNQFFITEIPVAAVTLLAIVFVIQEAAPGRPLSVATLSRAALTNPGITALLGLAAMPLGLIFVSVVLQPSLIPRYAIITALFAGPLVALALHELPRSVKAVAIVSLCVPLGMNLGTQHRNWRAYTIGVAAQTKSYELAVSTGAPVVFPGFHEIYQVLGGNRRTPVPARFLDLPDDKIRALYPTDRLWWLRNLRGVEVRSGVSHSRVYGFPPVIAHATLDTTRLFALIAQDLLVAGPNQAENWGRVVFPNHRVVRINEHVSLFERIEQPSRRSKPGTP